MSLISQKAEKIRLILLDVDGVLTNGGIMLDNQGNEMKVFNTRDGMGITLARSAGLLTGILTGRTSECVRRRAEELRFDIVEQGHFDKLPAFDSICSQNDIQPEEIAYMGDDLLDTPIMNRVGLAGAPADAHACARNAADCVTENAGGAGAVREFIDLILDAKHLRDQTYSGFVK